jgi:hypothetical protein
VNKVIGWCVVVGATKVMLENKVFRILLGYTIGIAMKYSAFFAHAFVLFAVKLKKPYFIPPTLVA